MRELKSPEKYVCYLAGLSKIFSSGKRSLQSSIVKAGKYFYDSSKWMNSFPNPGE